MVTIHTGGEAQVSYNPPETDNPHEFKVRTLAKGEVVQDSLYAANYSSDPVTRTVKFFVGTKKDGFHLVATYFDVISVVQVY